MLTATLLAAAAAVMHAAWNLAVKQSRHDRFVTMWGQVLLGAIPAGVVLAVLGGVNAQAWMWASLSAVVHIPYTVLLARAYDHGDYSHVYPLARGGGALAAGIGGVVLLDDTFTRLGACAVGVILAGLVILTGRARGPAFAAAIGVACSIGTYTLLDSRGSRVSDVAWYGLAAGVAGAVAVSGWGLATGRGPALVRVIRTDGHRLLLGGLGQQLTYTFVLAAVRLASVGYVTAIRESSVVIAALVGWRFLGEGDARRRLCASVVVLSGLILLIATA